MGWVDPRVGLGWVGSGMGRTFVFLEGWVGLVGCKLVGVCIVTMCIRMMMMT